jgi:Zn finger protein HypA/HybF involved in hydrogenase expression
MHEVSLVADLVEIVLDRAAQTPVPVTTVRVRYATTVPADGLLQAFTLLTNDTPLAGVTLDAQPFDRVLDCPACGFHGPLGHDDVVGGIGVCHRYDQATALPPTAEIELLGLS